MSIDSNWLIICFRYTMILIYYAFSLVIMMFFRLFLVAKFVPRGTKSVYAALYMFPILALLHATCAGLICECLHITLYVSYSRLAPDHMCLICECLHITLYVSYSRLAPRHMCRPHLWVFTHHFICFLFSPCSKPHVLASSVSVYTSLYMFPILALLHATCAGLICECLHITLYVSYSRLAPRHMCRPHLWVFTHHFICFLFSPCSMPHVPASSVSVYTSLYMFPILALLHATCAGLICECLRSTLYVSYSRLAPCHMCRPHLWVFTQHFICFLFSPCSMPHVPASSVSVYAALYMFPILALLHATCAGLICECLHITLYVSYSRLAPCHMCRPHLWVFTHHFICFLFSPCSTPHVPASSVSVYTSLYMFPILALLQATCAGLICQCLRSTLYVSYSRLAPRHMCRPHLWVFTQHFICFLFSPCSKPHVPASSVSVYTSLYMFHILALLHATCAGLICECLHITLYVSYSRLAPRHMCRPHLWVFTHHFICFLFSPCSKPHVPASSVSVYAALYMFPILALLHATCAGLICECLRSTLYVSYSRLAPRHMCRPHLWVFTHHFICFLFSPCSKPHVLASSVSVYTSLYMFPILALLQATCAGLICECLHITLYVSYSRLAPCHMCRPYLWVFTQHFICFLFSPCAGLICECLRSTLYVSYSRLAPRHMCRPHLWVFTHHFICFLFSPCSTPHVPASSVSVYTSLYRFPILALLHATCAGLICECLHITLYVSYSRLAPRHMCRPHLWVFTHHFICFLFSPCSMPHVPASSVSVYAALYMFPILALLQATCAGLICECLRSTLYVSYSRLAPCHMCRPHLWVFTHHFICFLFSPCSTPHVPASSVSVYTSLYMFPILALLHATCAGLICECLHITLYVSYSRLAPSHMCRPHLWVFTQHFICFLFSPCSMPHVPASSVSVYAALYMFPILALCRPHLWVFTQHFICFLISPCSKPHVPASSVSVYASLYMFPILALLQATCAGLICECLHITLYVSYSRLAPCHMCRPHLWVFTQHFICFLFSPCSTPHVPASSVSVYTSLYMFPILALLHATCAGLICECLHITLYVSYSRLAPHHMCRPHLWVFTHHFICFLFSPCSTPHVPALSVSSFPMILCMFSLYYWCLLIYLHCCTYLIIIDMWTE